MTTEELDEIAKKLALCSVDSLGGESLQRALARITKAPATDWRTVMGHIADLIDHGVCYKRLRRKRIRCLRQRLRVLRLRLQGRGRGALPRERHVELVPPMRQESAAEEK